MRAGRYRIGAAAAAVALSIAAAGSAQPPRDLPNETESSLPSPVLDDVALRQEYQQYRASVAGMRVYRVRYIRAASESAARDLIAMIDNGAAFEDVARAHSIHDASAGQGGDLGTHATCRWAKATLAMLEALDEGQAWPEPVKGTHGWGIYRLESVRDLEPRGFQRYKRELLSGRFDPECPWVAPLTVAPAGAAEPEAPRIRPGASPDVAPPGPADMLRK